MLTAQIVQGKGCIVPVFTRNCICRYLHKLCYMLQKGMPRQGSFRTFVKKEGGGGNATIVESREGKDYSDTSSVLYCNDFFISKEFYSAH